MVQDFPGAVGTLGAADSQPWSPRPAPCPSIWSPCPPLLVPPSIHLVPRPPPLVPCPSLLVPCPPPRSPVHPLWSLNLSIWSPINPPVVPCPPPGLLSTLLVPCPSPQSPVHPPGPLSIPLVPRPSPWSPCPQALSLPVPPTWVLGAGRFWLPWVTLEDNSVPVWCLLGGSYAVPLLGTPRLTPGPSSDRLPALALGFREAGSGTCLLLANE